MVKSESADEESMLSSDKVSGNEEEDEFCQWSHPQRRASSSCRTAEEETQHSSATCILASNDEQAGRRMRRQIANCNERRRMQSINAGFQSLRSLLPKRDGEKMSKAAILQHTAELIQTLQAEKNRLLEEKEAAIQSRKRRLEDEEARDRGIVDELTLALERERRLRQLYEQQLRERRPASPLLSSLTVAANHPSSIGTSSIESSVLGPQAEISGLIHHPLLALNGFVGTAPYLVRPHSGFPSSASLSVDRNMSGSCNSALSTPATVTATRSPATQQQQSTTQANVDTVSRTPVM
uniref:BHLH domain-containing protein n=1 Tax=Syphacia muris TaxID=451379 RepID=A0A158R4M5_9BILA